MSANFAIVNLRDGIRRDLEPFLINNDAFPLLENAYLFRGRIQRRSCFAKLGSGDSRLGWQIGTTNGAGNFGPFNLPDGATSNLPGGVVQFIVSDGVTSETFTDPDATLPDPVNLLRTGSGTGTLNRTAPANITITGSVANAAVFYFPGLPVMGLRTREQSAINDELLIGFDTRYSYIYDTGTENFIAANTFKSTNSVFIWNGTDSDFFWTTNYYSVLWTTNNIPGLNAYTISNGTDAIPSVITIGVGHNLVNGDIVMIADTTNSTTLNGRTFTVQNSNPGAGTFEINNTVLPGAAFNSGFVVVLNRQVNTIAGTIRGDGIKWYDGPGVGTGWVNFVPPLNSATPQRLLRGALIILPYKDRLICLNTFESTSNNTVENFKQRARYSQNGTPFFTEDNASPAVEYLLPTNQTAQFDAWFDNVTGKGGFIDAPTGEAIISAEFIKDTLIVYFERSTWQLVYTSNELVPFVWQKINTELGTESTFSIVPFDRGVFGVGNYGIITTDSVNVIRLDQKIPDEVFNIQNLNNGVKRVYGVRDYNAQLVYWTYPIRDNIVNESLTYELTFPNRVLVYNYLDNSWAYFDDSFTCFGYWQSVRDKTWADLLQTWQSTSFSWNSQVTIAKYPDVVAGNQRGFVFIVSQQLYNGQNVPSLEISNITIAVDTINATLTIPDHNLVNNDFILITDAVGVVNFNDRIFKILSSTVDTISIRTTLDLPFSGTYQGGGFVTFMPNFSIQTKQFNPFYEKGDSVRLNFVDVYIDRTEAGEFTAKFFTNSNTSVSLPQLDPSLPRDPIVLTSPETAIAFSSGQTRIWHRIYIDAFGSFFQNEFTLSDVQMVDLDITTSNIRIHGLVYYVNPAGRISYDI